jgi:hypothetical protein
MKKSILFLVLIMSTLTAFSQKDEEFISTGNSDEIKTLMGNNKALGGYGALSMEYTQIDDRDAFVFGARGGVLMGHIITLGIGGSGFFNDVHYDSNLGADISLAGGYGGFFFEPVLMPKMPVHIAFPIMIGAGGVSVVRNNNSDWLDDFDFKSEESDAFMVIEPGIEVELNITRFFRFCIGGYYRYTTDVEIENPEFNIPANIIRGFSGGVTFKFGKF